MEEFKTYILEELTIGKGSYGIAAPAIPFNPSKHTYLRITDINDDGTLNKQGLMSVDDENASNYILKENDIVFARTGNSTGRSYFYDGADGELVYAGFLIKFSIDKKKVNPRILKYYTHSKPYFNWVRSFDTGGTRGNINAKTYGTMPITLPSREVQDKIVSILKSLDDKIELNRRINGNLEQQAQALYAKAFSSTNTCKMGDVVETISGGTPSRKNQNYFSSQGIKWIKSKELNGSFIFDSEEHISDDGLCNSSAKLLPPNSTLIAMYGATVGAYGLTIDDATCNQAICALLPNSQYPYTYLYMWAKNNKDELIQKAIGSAQQNISQIIIKNMPVANEKDKIIRFDSDTRYIFSLMKSLAKENRNLIALRDALLPRLMSGELKINDLNR